MRRTRMGLALTGVTRVSTSSATFPLQSSEDQRKEVMGDHAAEPSPAQAHDQRKRFSGGMQAARRLASRRGSCNRTSSPLVTASRGGVGSEPRSRRQAYRNLVATNAL